MRRGLRLAHLAKVPSWQARTCRTGIGAEGAIKPLLLAFAVLALPAGAVAQPATTAKTYAEVSGWTVKSYSVAGTHMRCGAVAPGEPGALTSLEKSREGWTLVVRTAAKGDSLKGVVDVDGKRFGGDFFRMDDNRVGLFLKAVQLKSIESGKAMTVRISGESTKVPLAGIAPVIASVAQCDRTGGV
jgi:hypothetical protein